MYNIQLLCRNTIEFIRNQSTLETNSSEYIKHIQKHLTYPALSIWSPNLQPAMTAVCETSLITVTASNLNYIIFWITI
jgi:hypothetical protein